MTLFIIILAIFALAYFVLGSLLEGILDSIFTLFSGRSHNKKDALKSLEEKRAELKEGKLTQEQFDELEKVFKSIYKI